MCNYFKIQTLVQEKKSFKGFSIFSSGSLFNRAERFEQFGRWSPKEPSCEIISKSVWQFLRGNHLKQKVDNARTTDKDQSQ